MLNKKSGSMASPMMVLSQKQSFQALYLKGRSI